MERITIGNNNEIKLRQCVDGWWPVGQRQLTVVEKLEPSGIEAVVGINESVSWMNVVTASGNTNVIGEAKIYFPTHYDSRYRVNCHVPDIGSFTDIYMLDEEFEKRVNIDRITNQCKFDVVCSTTKDVYRLELLIKEKKPEIRIRCDELHRHENRI